tara:strand:+ start:86 stop:1006 length:921 start_codon:yes stop_codon:yes gene_type:complete
MQEPRQLYGLGSLVKKITKPIKKIIKSPIGKAALLGAAAFGIPGTGIGGLFGRAGFGGAATGLLGKQGIGATLFGVGALPPSQGLGVDKGLFGKFFGKMGTGTKLGIAGGLLTYLGSQGMSEEEIEETKRDPDKLRVYLKDYFSKLNPNASDEEVEQFVETNVSEYATGGRVGFKDGKNMMMASAPDPMDALNDMAQMLFGKNLDELTDDEYEALQEKARDSLAVGGMPTGIMRTNQAGTMERDYRETGGFVPVGIKEKADDVPAMLSKNEFVMTADAVRGMGDGSIEKGAQKLYDQMKRLENKVA